MESGDRRIGVVWHTQGSGKSLSMVFYAGKLVINDELENPTIVIITDRNDLDDQLFGTFMKSKNILRSTPVQATDRTHLRELLNNRTSGGIIFTTIHKFALFVNEVKEGIDDYSQLDKVAETSAGYGIKKVLTDRKNVIVMAEAAVHARPNEISGNIRAGGMNTWY